MTTELRKAFTTRRDANDAAFVAFLTAGYPTLGETIPLMLAMQRNGVDVIELGVPFTEPVADGPVIQAANDVALKQGIDLFKCINLVAEARQQGLTVPVVLMGYYNPIYRSGEQKVIEASKKAGVNGFIIVDLPPEEAESFLQLCKAYDLSYVPLISPVTKDARVSYLASIADSFMYVVSRMGITGASSSVSDQLAPHMSHLRSLTGDVPLAVGFGISNQEHFREVAQVADGVVIGSKLIQCINGALEQGKSPIDAVSEFCSDVSAEPRRDSSKRIKIDASEAKAAAAKDDDQDARRLRFQQQGRFGDFGGAYVAETLYGCLEELSDVFDDAIKDPNFIKQWESTFEYINRPSVLYPARRLTEEAKGAQIWFKREDLNHTGSHKINNAMGQILLAKRLGKNRIIAETGAGQHGVATATACAREGLECVIYMGAEDVRRQALNVFRMKMLGAKVIAVESGSKTLKDAINEALRDWATNLSTTHYLVGSAIGPHPFPTIVRYFQSVIGREIKSQLREKTGDPNILPTALVACVGGGSNAIGTFSDFIDEPSVRLIGVEASGDGLSTDRHSATLSKGSPGVLHGVRTYLIQDENGQVVETHSVSAGLDYPGVGPQHAFLHASGRGEYIAASDADALVGFRLSTELEGIIPALESSHAVFAGYNLAKTLPADANVVITMSGRGDKDVEEIYNILPRFSDRIGWHIDANPTGTA